MAEDFAINTLLARNSPSDEGDVFNTKTLLNRIGYYDEPSYGITPYPDGRLFQSIAKFQKDHDLAVDGWMKPGGETEQALKLVSRRGRPGLEDGDFGFPSADDFDLAGEVGKGHASAGNDVMMAKRAMGALGYYPKRLLLDPTDIVDRELHNGITQFQSDNTLYSDGWMAPDGETAGAVREALAKREDRVRPFNPLLDTSTVELRSDTGGDGAGTEQKKAPRGDGGSGDDALVGGRGNDTLVGGMGNDDSEVGRRDPNADPMFPSPDPAALEADYRRKVRDGRAAGLTFAADLLEHYLNGSGETVTVPAEEARARKPIQDAEAINRSRIQESFTDSQLFTEALNNMKEGETIVLPRPRKEWSSSIKGEDLVKKGEADLFIATGTSNISSPGNYTATRRGDTIYIEGVVEHRWNDSYDFEEGTLYAKNARILENDRDARPFNLESSWKQRVEGTVRIEDSPQGPDLTDPIFHWQDVKD